MMVDFGSALDTTSQLENVSPFSVSTPAARPFSMMILLTGIPVLIVAPLSRAACASASVTLLMPPAGESSLP